MSDITNVRMGACSVSFDGVDLGHTKGGVEFNYEPDYQEVTVDKYGSTPVEKYLIGEKVTIKCNLAEDTIANLNVAIPQGTQAGSGNARLTLGSNAGKAASDDAAQLVLHPLALASSTRTYDVVLYKAYVDSAVTVPYKNDEETVVEVTFVALLDETKSDGNYLGLIGDSAA